MRAEQRRTRWCRSSSRRGSRRRTSAITTKTLRTRSARVRPASTAERAIGSDRNRSMRPLLQVVGEADAGGERAEHDRLHEDPGHQEVDVGLTRRQAALDRAAEHVAEHQHEDDRLDRGEHQQLRVAPDVEQVAPRDRERVADGVDATVATRRRGRGGVASWSCGDFGSRRWPASPSSSVGSSAVWPVSSRNTSSSVGSRSTIVAGVEVRARRGARTASSIAGAAPSATLTRTQRCRRAADVADRRERARRRARAASSSRKPTSIDGRAEPGLQLRGGALGDHRCRGR